MRRGRRRRRRGGGRAEEREQASQENGIGTVIAVATMRHDGQQSPPATASQALPRQKQKTKTREKGSTGFYVCALRYLVNLTSDGYHPGHPHGLPLLLSVAPGRQTPHRSGRRRSTRCARRRRHGEANGIASTARADV
ncbi:unnamed protein product [Prorocentrum cordatum]|uniref:Uncharacterized protein n=1 Tax=Prorocentrum cordatum TaxID=2364126 RepID=A0ABN9SS91_9DINO|nr:unnamed protein product [Polarella glacialis]